MSAETTVTVTRTEDGRYTAVDASTGAFGRGESTVDALADLLELLRAVQKVEEASSRLDPVSSIASETESWETDGDPVERYEALSSRVQKRVRDEDVDEDVVAEAIEWARSS